MFFPEFDVGDGLCWCPIWDVPLTYCKTLTIIKSPTQRWPQNHGGLWVIQVKSSLFLSQNGCMLPRWQWCWWHCYVGDFMRLTCETLFHDQINFATKFTSWQAFLSRTSDASLISDVDLQFSHQHRCDLFRCLVVFRGPLILIVHVFMLSEPKTFKIKVQHSSYFRISLALLP